MDKTPNHICKNPNCHKGDDGGSRHYWACNDCDRQESWRKAACDEECYVEYLDAIAVERGEKHVVAADSDQLSLFDEPVVVDAPASVEPVVEEQRTTSAAPFAGYYSKKNKHRSSN